MFDHLSPYTTLDSREFISFVDGCLNKQHKERAAAFCKIDADKSGPIDASALAELLASLDVTLMKQVVTEILQEVDEDNAAALNLQEFEKVDDLLHRREGFSKLGSIV